MTKRALTFVLGAAALCAQSPEYSQIANGPSVTSAKYAFTRTNGKGASGDLSASGAGKTVTMTPCPSGVLPGNAYHYVKLNGGVGTAEWVLLTNIAAVGTACTVTFTTVNTHTGAWAITGSGIREAIAALASTGGRISVPAGTHTACGIDFANVSGIRLEGAAVTATANGTVLACDSATLPVIHVRATYAEIRHFTLKHTVSPLSATAIGLTTPNGGGDYILLDDILAINNYDGFYFSLVSRGYGSNLTALNNTSDGFRFDPTAVYWQWDFTNTYAGLNGGVGYNLTTTRVSAFPTPGPRFHKIYTFANGSYGVKVDADAGAAVSAVQIDGGFLGSDNNSCIYMNSRGYQHSIANIKIEYCGTNGESIGYPAATAASSNVGYGIEVTANNTNNLDAMKISGVQIHAAAYSGIVLNSPATVSGSAFTANGYVKSVAQDYHRAGISIRANQSMVDNNYFNSVGDTYTLYAIEVSGTVTETHIGKMYVQPSFIGTEVKWNTVPTTIGPGYTGIRKGSFGATCATAASAGATCTTAYTFTGAGMPDMPDDAYVASCMLSSPTGVPNIVGITAASTTGFTIMHSAQTAAAASAAAVQCVFMR
jgi:hypothetical protein